MKNSLRFLCPRPGFVCALVMLAGLIVHTSPAISQSIQPFIGDYTGHSIASESELDKRDLGVSIKKKKKGFSVTWTTITQRASGKTKKKTYSIDFQSTKRDSIYASAMKTDVFGGRVPLDPIKGDPYVWARIDGNTLTVHAMIVTDDGGYEMQVYDRTLSDGGLKLKFSRIRDGQPLKLIEGTLIRSK